MLKLAQFIDVRFANLNPNSYDNLNNMKLDLNVSTRSANFSANNRAFSFSLQISVITSSFQVAFLCTF